MGGDVPKPLLRFRGKSLLRMAVEAAIDVPTAQVLVVVGNHADLLLKELEGTPATAVVNEHWAEGQSTSLRGGLAAVAPEARGVFVYPSDMPFVTADVLRALAARQQATGRPAVMTEVGGVRGVPVLVTRSLFPPLMIQEGDVGGAQYLRAHPELVETVHFEDPEIVRDIDRPEDYRALRERYEDEWELDGAPLSERE